MTPTTATAPVDTTTTHFDVIIVGAGLSGIGAAHQIQATFPGKTYAVLEARSAIGGTWDLFKYPGIRSDSDMQTLGYSFKPWVNDLAIAPAEQILDYIRSVAAESGIDRHIRYNHKITGASWSTADARWTVTAQVGGQAATYTCSFLYGCAGYYNYDEGYTPRFQGRERFAGQVVHPQHWPQDLNYAGKKVVVIGSGATAVTLVPSMAEAAGHVTMLQRTPTYVMAIPAKDHVGNALRRVLGAKAAHPVIRWKNVAQVTALYQVSQRAPKLVKALLKGMQKAQLPRDFDVDTHFAPDYKPWDQRMCMVPGGDLFTAIRRGKASIVTDRIANFTERGILLESGAELEADIVVTATGLNLQVNGGIKLSVDGADVVVPERMVYKGMMFDGVPNFAFTVGYTNISWTLKADLVAGYVVRALKHMDATGATVAMPVNDDPQAETTRLLDFDAGYVLRAADVLPRAGTKAPWKLGATYAQDVVTFRFGKLADGAMRFAGSAA